MREISQRARDVLAGGIYDITWVGDLIYDGVPRAQNLPLSAPRFSWDGTRQVQGSGSCTVAWSDVFGQSIVPREIGDVFSPFGAELQADVMLTAGTFVERIAMGRFVLDRVPDAVEYAVAHPLPPRVPTYSPWVEQRRNEVRNPQHTVDASGWGGSTGVSPERVAFDDGWGVLLHTTGGQGTTAYLSYAVAGAPGQFWAARVKIGAGPGLPAGANVRIAVHDGTGYVASKTFTVPSVSTVVDIPAASATVGSAPRLYVYSSSTPAWGTAGVILTDVQMERVAGVGQTLGLFFDGSTNPAGVLERTRWLGTANASPSVVETRERSWVDGVAAPVVVESTVRLDLLDAFIRVKRDSFAFPSSPKSDSMWDEAQRLTGLPVFRSIPDRTLPTTLTYEKDRADALEAVFAAANAWPALTPQGALTAMSKDWPAPVGRIERVLDSPLEMRSEAVYNRVVVEGKNPDAQGAPLIAVREITDGLLRVRNADGSRSPFGGNTYRVSLDSLTTQAQCDAHADELLPRVSRLRAVTRTVTEPFNPLREVGDVYVLVDKSRRAEESVVRVRQVEHAGAVTTLNVEVAS